MHQFNISGASESPQKGKNTVTSNSHPKHGAHNLSQIGFFYEEPFLTELSNRTDGRYPSFDQNKLAMVRDLIVTMKTVSDMGSRL